MILLKRVAEFVQQIEKPSGYRVVLLLQYDHMPALNAPASPVECPRVIEWKHHDATVPGKSDSVLESKRAICSQNCFPKCSRCFWHCPGCTWIGRTQRD